jgi:hypothetical protein
MVAGQIVVAALWEHVDRFDDAINGWVGRARFMAADFAGQRYGVYFEAGMQSLGQTV